MAIQISKVLFVIHVSFWEVFDQVHQCSKKCLFCSSMLALLGLAESDCAPGPAIPMKKQKTTSRLTNHERGGREDLDYDEVRPSKPSQARPGKGQEMVWNSEIGASLVDLNNTVITNNLMFFLISNSGPARFKLFWRSELIPQTSSNDDAQASGSG